jgi:sporulation protein YlmC with PRC-barrel domain
MKMFIYASAILIAAASSGWADENKAVALASNLKSPQLAGNITISDLVLDLREGIVAAAIAFVEKPKDELVVRRLIPYQLLRGDILAGIEQCPECSKEPVTRQAIESLFLDFNLKAYWLENGKPRIRTALPKSAPEFQLLSSLVGKGVHGKDNEKIGTISDIAVGLDSGEIVYCVLKSNDKELRAVPLGAFSSIGAGKHWEIELTKDAVMRFKPFDPMAPPVEVDGGWIEYVAVRYGRDSLQTEPRKPDEQ